MTHQAQIASKATNHFKVSKSNHNNNIKTFVEILMQDEKIMELARLISGNKIENESLLVAKKMLLEN